MSTGRVFSLTAKIDSSFPPIVKSRVDLHDKSQSSRIFHQMIFLFPNLQQPDASLFSPIPIIIIPRSMQYLNLHPPPLPSPNTPHLLLQLCHNQHLFLVLYEYLHHSDYVVLLQVGKAVHGAVQGNQAVEVHRLQQKVRKLRKRGERRRDRVYLGVDLGMFEGVQRDEEGNEEGLVDEKTVGETVGWVNKDDSQFAMRRQKWTSWTPGRRMEVMLGLRSFMTLKPVPPRRPPGQSIPRPISEQQRVRAIQQAERIIAIHNQFKKQLVNQLESTDDNFELIRRRHFAQRFLSTPSASQHTQNHRSLPYLAPKNQLQPHAVNTSVLSIIGNKFVRTLLDPAGYIIEKQYGRNGTRRKASNDGTRLTGSL